MPDAAPDVRSKRLQVLCWTDHFFGADYLADRLVEGPDGSSIALSFTTDRGRLEDADAVWFHAPSITDLPPRKRQPWVLMSMESDVNYPMLREPKTWALFDHSMTYRLDSDVPCIYLNRDLFGSFEGAPSERLGPSSGALALYCASNPVPLRDSYVAELMRYVPIDSLGACLRNRWIDGFDASGLPGLLSMLPRYKFHLAFENSVTTDYVTEKIFLPLSCGVVPVYLGAGNVRDFMPAADAIIDVADFASPRALADYLLHLDADDDAYARHLRWKREGSSSNFKKLLDFGSSDPLRRLAVKLAHGCGHSCRCGGRLRERGLV